MEKILLIGYGGHAKSIADCIERQNEFQIAGYTDSEEKDAPYQYLGADDVLADCFQRGIRNAVICVGYLGEGRIRQQLYEMAKEIGFQLPVIVDPSAAISKTAEIGEGSFVGKNAVINAYSNVGKMTIINSLANVGHDCVVGDYTHIAGSSVLCGADVIGDWAFIGANATLLQTIHVGECSIIGAGSVVLEDVPDDCTSVGNPAGLVKTHEGR